MILLIRLCWPSVSWSVRLLSSCISWTVQLRQLQFQKNNINKYLIVLSYYERDFLLVFIDNSTDPFVCELDSHLACFFYMYIHVKDTNDVVWYCLATSRGTNENRTHNMYIHSIYSKTYRWATTASNIISMYITSSRFYSP